MRWRRDRPRRHLRRGRTRLPCARSSRSRPCDLRRRSAARGGSGKARAAPSSSASVRTRLLHDHHRTWFDGRAPRASVIPTEPLHGGRAGQTDPIEVTPRVAVLRGRRRASLPSPVRADSGRGQVGQPGSSAIREARVQAQVRHRHGRVISSAPPQPSEVGRRSQPESLSRAVASAPTRPERPTAGTSGRSASATANGLVIGSINTRRRARTPPASGSRSRGSVLQLVVPRLLRAARPPTYPLHLPSNYSRTRACPPTRPHRGHDALTSSGLRASLCSRARCRHAWTTRSCSRWATSSRNDCTT